MAVPIPVRPELISKRSRFLSYYPTKFGGRKKQFPLFVKPLFDIWEHKISFVMAGNCCRWAHLHTLFLYWYLYIRLANGHHCRRVQHHLFLFADYKKTCIFKGDRYREGWNIYIYFRLNVSSWPCVCLSAPGPAAAEQLSLRRARTRAIMPPERDGARGGCTTTTDNRFLLLSSPVMNRRECKTGQRKKETA